jgi:hypothetical protein
LAACDMLFLRATEPCSRGVFDPLDVNAFVRELRGGP